MVRKTFLHNLLYWLIALSVLTPLIAFQHVVLEPLFFKTMAFFLVTELMLLVYLILLFQDKVQLPKNNWINWSLVGLLAVLGISTLVSDNPSVSFWGSAHRIMGFMTWLHLIIYSLIAGAVVINKTDWLRLLRIVIVTSIFVVLYGIGQYLGWGFLVSSENSRIDSVMTNPLFLASYLLVVFPITIFHTVLTKQMMWRILGGVMIILQGWLLLTTASRGAFLALALAGVATILVIAIIRKSYKWLWWGIAVILVMVGSYSVIYMYRHTSLVQKTVVLRRISEINLTHVSAQSRIFAWEQGLESWQSKPVFGWGLENQLSANNLTYEPHGEKTSIRETWFDRFHNLIVDWLVTTGVVGLLMYLILAISIFGLAIKYLFRAKTRWKKMIGFTSVAVLVAYLSFNLFAFDVIMGTIYFMLVVALISSQIGKSNFRITKSWFYPVFLVTVLALYSASLRPVFAGQTMSIAIGAYYQGQVDIAFQKAGTALSYNTFLNNFMKDKMLSTSLDIFEQINDPDQRTGIGPYFAQVTDWMSEIDVDDPYAVYYYSNTLNFYSRWVGWDTTVLDKGEEILSRLEDISPTRPNTQMMAGQMYLALNRDDDAIARFEKAIALFPEWGNPYYALAVIYAKQGDLAQMNNNLDKAKANGFVVFETTHIDTLITAMENSLPMEVVNQEQKKLVVKALIHLADLASESLFIGNRDLAYNRVMDMLKLDSDNVVALDLLSQLNKINAKYAIPYTN
jgi:O-antigen ligase